MNALLNFLGADSYLAHSVCLTSDPWIIWLYAVHDMMIFVSYMVIATLNLLTKGALSGPGFIGFSAFIFLCGVSHLTKTLVLYSGVYRLDVVVVAATGWISAAIALYTTLGYLEWRSKQPR